MKMQLTPFGGFFVSISIWYDVAMKKRKCYTCRKEFIPKKGEIFCKDCIDKPREPGAMGTLIIYDTV